ncbi:hypothetical protein B0H11DRAFT_1304812 [Mycena galericulata]|nr:hypothetical protein B0H11DRAFT_1304812 [Mycena galericulata]
MRPLLPVCLLSIFLGMKMDRPPSSPPCCVPTVQALFTLDFATGRYPFWYLLYLVPIYLKRRPPCRKFVNRHTLDFDTLAICCNKCIWRPPSSLSNLTVNLSGSLLSMAAYMFRLKLYLSLFCFLSVYPPCPQWPPFRPAPSSRYAGLII